MDRIWDVVFGILEFPFWSVDKVCRMNTTQCQMHMDQQRKLVQGFLLFGITAEISLIGPIDTALMIGGFNDWMSLKDIWHL